MLANIVEDDLAVSDDAGTIPPRKWLHTVDDLSVHEDFTFLRYLKQKDFSLVVAAVAVVEVHGHTRLLETGLNLARSATLSSPRGALFGPN